MGTLSHLSRKSRWTATVLLVSWLLLPLAVGAEHDRDVIAAYNPLRSSDAVRCPDQRLFDPAPWAAEWNPGSNVLRNGPSGRATAQPARATLDGELPRRLLVVPESLAENRAAPVQPSVARPLPTVSRSNAQPTQIAVNPAPPKRLLVVPEGTAPSVATPAAQSGDRLAQSANGSQPQPSRAIPRVAPVEQPVAVAQASKPNTPTPQRPVITQVAQAVRLTKAQPPQSTPVVAPTKQPMAVAWVSKPNAPTPQRLVIAQVARAARAINARPPQAMPSPAPVEPPMFLARVSKRNASAPCQPANRQAAQAVVEMNAQPPRAAAGYAPARQPLVLAQIPRPSIAQPRPSDGVRLVQAVSEPALPMEPIAEPMPPAEPMRERMPPVVDLPDGEVIPVDESMPLTNVCPQMWSSCESACRCGVMCPDNRCRHTDRRWQDTQMIPWQVFAQGEYVGPARLAHVPIYRLRVDDYIRMVYGFTGQPSPTPYRLAVGDVVQVESNGDPKVDRTVTVQPDGMVTLRYLGQVRAAGYSLQGLQRDLESRYARFIREPAVSLTPVKLNSRLEELRQAVDQRYGPGGQGVYVRVTPAGTVQLPSIGSIPVQGLTLEEVKREIEARYAARFWGVEVTPVLDRRAPRYLFVLGEVRNPGRYELEGPTTALQAIAMAGGWNVGAELRQAVVFRRDDCWRLMATKLHLCGAVRGTHPCPADEIWLRDSDILLLPKSHLLEADDMIELLFTRGLYGVVPFNMTMSWTRLTTL